LEQSQLPSGWQRGSPTSPGGQVPNSISRKSVRARSLQREHGLQPAGGPFGCSITSFHQGSTPGKQLPHGQLPFSHGAPGTQPVQLPVHLISTHGPGSVCCPAVCAGRAGSQHERQPSSSGCTRAHTHTTSAASQLYAERSPEDFQALTEWHAVSFQALGSGMTGRGPGASSASTTSGATAEAHRMNCAPTEPI
jgi:hypothetical protein